MEVLAHAAAGEEYRELPEREQDAMDNAIAKLRVLGDRLPYPHSSATRSEGRFRGLQLRAASSPWRAFYRRFGDVAIIGAFGPEAKVDPRGFRDAVQRAMDRLAAYEAKEGYASWGTD